MAKEKKYVRINYNEKNDAFDLEISTNGGKSWELTTSVNCVHSMNDDEQKEKFFVHCSIISTLNEIVWTGYDYWPYGKYNAPD